MIIISCGASIAANSGLLGLLHVGFDDIWFALTENVFHSLVRMATEFTCTNLSKLFPVLPTPLLALFRQPFPFWAGDYHWIRTREDIEELHLVVRCWKLSSGPDGIWQGS